VKAASLARSVAVVALLIDNVAILGVGDVDRDLVGDLLERTHEASISL
jgi:hypothetical protein